MKIHFDANGVIRKVKINDVKEETNPYSGAIPGGLDELRLLEVDEGHGVRAAVQCWYVIQGGRAIKICR
jgi:hypothetical protein